MFVLLQYGFPHRCSALSRLFRLHSIVRKAKPPRKNLFNEKSRAINNLCSNKNIIILPADKGNATIVINTCDYEIKMESLLNDPSYKKVTNDSTTYLVKVTRNKIKATSIDPDTQTKLIHREKSFKCPKLYGLPKIHKPDVPLRPIVS
ncbi:hypothetical protein Trydic_g16205 [Trypoxylus dichotomus]